MHKNLFLAVSISAGAIALVLGSGAAQAASYGNTSPIYVGGGVGRSSHQAAEDSGAGKVYAGFSLAPMTAWPGSELTGSIELNAVRGAWTGRRSAGGEERFTGTGVGYRLMLRETEALSLSGRLGLAHMKGRSRAGLTAGSEGSTGLSAGLGLSYALGKHLSITADYDLLRAAFPLTGSTHVHMFTIGAGYKL